MIDPDSREWADLSWYYRNQKAFERSTSGAQYESMWLHSVAADVDLYPRAYIPFVR